MTTTRFPEVVHLIEVGPRDGLQNEPHLVPTEIKARWIAMLIQAGLRTIEVTSFVAPSKVPQLADSEDLLSLLPEVSDVHYAALVPNERGFMRSRHGNLDTIAVFTAASERFTHHNIGCSIEESLSRFVPVVAEAHQLGDG